MNGSASTPGFPTEDLLMNFGKVLAARCAQDMPFCTTAGFDGRSVLAGFLALFVCAPGCAAAAVFLMKADERPMVETIEARPSVSKADRLPLSQWKTGVPVDTAGAVDGPFYEVAAIRGRLDPDFPAVSAAIAAPVETPRPRPKRKRGMPRPAAIAEAALPQPAPSFLEQLFALRIL